MNRVLEIRVHGVSNTPPESMLSEYDVPAPEARLYAGDAQTGFYRRKGDPDDADLVTEAYSWGALTSGNQAKKDLQRAGWALLLPFAFANVALWARPGIRRQGFRGQASAYLVRLLAVSLTVSIVLAAAGVGMDQVGWQCRQGCRGIPGFGFLSSGAFWNTGLRPVVVGMLAPLLLLAVIVVLARRSFAYEAEVPSSAGGPSGLEPGPEPFAQQCFWAGERQVRALAGLHTAAALAAIAGVGTLAGLRTRDDAPVGGWQVLGWAAAVLGGVAMTLVLVMLGHRAIRERSRDDTSPAGVRVALWLAVPAVLATALFLLVPARSGLAVSNGLPGFGDTLQWLFIGQFGVVLLLGSLADGWWRAAITAALIGAGAVLACSRVTDTWRKDVVFLAVAALATTASLVALAGRPPRQPTFSEPVWGGRSAAMLAGTGWASGSLYSAAVLFWVADWLNGDATVTSSASAVQLPVPLLWSAMGLLVFAVPVLVAGVVAARRLARLRRDAGQAQRKALPPDCTPHQRRRSADVAAAIAVHEFVGRMALSMAGCLGGITVAFAVVGVAGAATGLSPNDLVVHLDEQHALDADWLAPVLKWLTDTGSALAGLALLGLAALVGLTYRSPRLRRSLGVVWDLATFWPRGAHPFAPPSYGERAVPQLLTRISGTPAESIVLAGHSQGAVLAVATVLQLPAERRRAVHLLTYGTQITRLYGRIFPAFFDRRAREHLAAALTDGSAEVRWCSLHRPTDQLGWKIDTPARIDVDVCDPSGLAPSGGEVLDPPIRRHSDYPCSPEYIKQRQLAIDRLSLPRP